MCWKSLNTSELVIGWLESIFTLMGILDLSINLLKINRHLLLVPWLIFAVSGQVTLFGLIIWVVAKNEPDRIIPLIMAFIINPIISYAIFSIYKKIRKIREEERPGNLGNLESGNVIPTKENESLLA